MSDNKMNDDKMSEMKRDEHDSTPDARAADARLTSEETNEVRDSVRVTESADVAGRGASMEGSDEWVAREINRKSRRSFLIGGIAAVAGYGGWRWLKASPDANGIPAPLRASHEFNEQLSQAYFSPSRLAPEFPSGRAAEPRVNGGEGLSAGFNPETWRLQVVGLANPTQYPQYRENIAYDTAMDNKNAGHDSSQRHQNPDSKSAPAAAPHARSMDRVPAMDMQGPGLLLTLDDIKALPRVEMTTELKCIEGWSTIVTWAGARFIDFAERFRPATQRGGAPDVRHRPQELVRYVSLVTPDGGYYVGMDTESALHPQTLLCYEMNGQPLSMEHGAPLRLVTPLKYGIKHIKRIGRITFTDARPADFWAERGYDWYSGH
jgi:hypothetical protein